MNDLRLWISGHSRPKPTGKVFTRDLYLPTPLWINTDPRPKPTDTRDLNLPEKALTRDLNLPKQQVRRARANAFHLRVDGDG